MRKKAFHWISQQDENLGPRQGVTNPPNRGRIHNVGRRLFKSVQRQRRVARTNALDDLLGQQCVSQIGCVQKAIKLGGIDTGLGQIRARLFSRVLVATVEKSG